MRSAASLSHAGIVTIFDVGVLASRLFIAMELVEGQPLPIQRAVELMVPVVKALARAHEFNIVHRDLKPTNVLLDPLQMPRLADFGVGGMAGECLQGIAGGSPCTMSPQQLAGQPPSVADDIYGFGTLLFEMLHGRPPGRRSGDEDHAPRPVEPLPQTLDRLLVSARTDGGIGLFWVAADAPGVVIHPDAIVDLTRDQAHISFDEVDAREVSASGLAAMADLSYPEIAFQVLSRYVGSEITPEDLRAVGAEIILANAYHLAERPGAAEIEALGPQTGSQGVVYPGTCKIRPPAPDRPAALRLDVGRRRSHSGCRS